MTISALRGGQEGRVPVTLAGEARAERLIDAGAAAAEETGTRVTLTAAIARLLVATLTDHPALNATLVDDDEMEYRTDVNLGVAVALENGALVVPVVHEAQVCTLAALAIRMADLAARARDGSLARTDTRGATFTLSSTGNIALPIVGTPSLTRGQAGILLAARIADRPVVEDGDVVAGKVLPLSLTFDHVAVNGVPALRFFGDLVRRVERPEQWIR